ncbi:hypothetical protein [Limosilactobacillus reuteri]|nr:hypothetical protein [Limosilactobacillus reuteri]
MTRKSWIDVMFIPAWRKWRIVIVIANCSVLAAEGVAGTVSMNSRS